MDDPWESDSGFWEDLDTLRDIEALTIAGVGTTTQADRRGQLTGIGPQSINYPRDNGRRNGGQASPSPTKTMTATFSRPSRQSQPQATRLPTNASKPSKPPFIISHCPRTQGELDRLGVPWGAQWELARGESRGQWTWNEVRGTPLKHLVGLNAEVAPKVANLVLQTQRSEAVDDVVWAEYDREQEAIAEDDDSRRGLGVYGDWAPWHRGSGDDWYGGRICQRARVVEVSGQLKVHLDAPIYAKNPSRFARFLGSRRMIRLSIPANIKAGLENFLSQRFLLCGRVFVALRPRDSKGGKHRTIFLIEVNEDFDRSAKISEGDHRRLSLREFVRWHNPIELNKMQPISKWITRFDLGLSPTIPVVEFHPNDVEFVRDTYPFGNGRTDIRPRNGELIADGCGFMNRTALDLVTQYAGQSEFCCAVQGRLGGSKGVWLLHPYPEHQLPDGSPPRVWIRDSQKKITHDESRHTDGRSRAYFIFDFVAPPRLSFPSRLNKQTIVNLSSNGVPTRVFEELLEAAVQRDFEDLTAWEGEESMEFLLSNVMRIGGISGARAARKAGSMARILGLRGREMEDIPVSQVSDIGFVEALELETSSGPPLALGEKIYDMITAGFHPLRSELLFESLKQFILNLIRSYVYDCKLPIPQSCEAFIVPDPFGVLEPDEIYFRANQNIVEDVPGGIKSDTVTGPVLINRNPTMLPSDMQRVTAVDKYHDVFRQYRNVIVCSAKGEQSLASKLAGGDYDGDTAVLTWKPEIVSAFRPPELTTVPRDFLSKNFEKQIEMVNSFLEKISRMNETEAEEETHRIFVSYLLNEPLTGVYSNMHGVSLYEKGYDHPETVRLAHMSNTCLDSSKTGLRVIPDVFKEDQRKYNKRLPESLAKDDDNSGGGPVATRPRRLGKFVLDALLEHGKKVWTKHNDKLKSKAPRGSKDPDLLQPYEEAERYFKNHPHSNQFKLLLEHVEKCRSAWTGLSSFARAPASPNPKARADAKQKQGLTVANIRKDFAVGPPPESISNLYSLPRGARMVKELKASYAYYLGEKFAVEVAFHDICALKASAGGDEYPVHGRFRDVTLVAPSVARRYNTQKAIPGSEQK